jgi:hypothetical protein
MNKFHNTNRLGLAYARGELDLRFKTKTETCVEIRWVSMLETSLSKAVSVLLLKKIYKKLKN